MKRAQVEPKSTFHVLPYALVTAGILAIPLVAMLFTEEVQWTLSDFIIMGALLFGAGMTYEFISKNIRNQDNRFIIAVVILSLVLYLWAELAVGIFTNWGS